MSDPIYYNVWRVDRNRWTNIGQNPNCPRLLSLTQAKSLSNNLNEKAWGTMKYEVRPVKMDEQTKRYIHAMKYL